MVELRFHGTGDGHPATLGDLIHTVTTGELPMRITAFDGTDVGPQDSPVRIEVKNRRGLDYLLTAPGDLGIARAYLMGDLEVYGIHPGNPYQAFQLLKSGVSTRRPKAREIADLAKGFELHKLRTPPLPAQEAPARWRRRLETKVPATSKLRAARAISHHYDVSNAFYEKVLGPSMAYTCAVYASDADTLEQAQERKFDLVAQKLALKPGMRLLDVGCGWGGMVRHAVKHYGVTAIGVTLSKEQASWASAAIERDGLSDHAEVRHLDYRDVPEADFDAISSIGLTEHIGVRNYPAYFGYLHGKLAEGGRLLNHCITRADNKAGARPEPFTDRYVFPDGELGSPSQVIGACHDAGFEVQHDENLRLHYAKTLAAWCQNLQDSWDFCVDEAGEGTAKVWGLYMAGSQFSFEANWLQLHQVLATKVGPEGQSSYPWRPDWDPSPSVS
ncbi:class I SAM-dependent methyltransferase [Arsenicicoccus piscis]|uniref:Cyclopropane-fatty-acyl-phospholipid synthase n=1 Tax=Arsenicicoccus piscis TaxID=673954 RepID=A0ABQ6HM19_9MICO|nr:class I SAM-dependent methyltransferase [Arsenicicoccus piscis]MCH8627297.1 class I SAM-dependent methyltransferase [Arsenicicoccus piscis]GMA18713.1 cyclopropane-fatty-acyl-phospholipid synthase [Arsenicicoccus piscis]